MEICTKKIAHNLSLKIERGYGRTVHLVPTIAEKAAIVCTLTERRDFHADLKIAVEIKFSFQITKLTTSPVAKEKTMTKAM